LNRIHVVLIASLGFLILGNPAALTAADDYFADYHYRGYNGKITQEFGRIHRSSSIVRHKSPRGLLQRPPSFSPSDVTFWVAVNPAAGILTTKTKPTYNKYLEKWNYKWTIVHWTAGPKPPSSTWSNPGPWPNEISQWADGKRDGMYLRYKKKGDELVLDLKAYSDGETISLSDLVFSRSDYDLHKIAQDHLDQFQEEAKKHKQQLLTNTRLKEIISVMQNEYKGQVSATRAELQLKMGLTREQIQSFITVTQLPSHRSSNSTFYFRVKETMTRARTLLYSNQWAHYELFE
jgi:hypothetical protein